MAKTKSILPGNARLRMKQMVLLHVKQALRNDEAYLPDGDRLGQTRLTACETGICATFVDVLGWFSEFEICMNLITRALTTSRKALGEIHHTTLQWKDRYARALVIISKYNDAEPIQREVLAQATSTDGLTSPLTNSALISLSVTLSYTGKHQEAETLLIKGLEERQKFSGSDLISLEIKKCLALVLSNAGDKLHAMNLLAEIVPLFSQKHDEQSALQVKLELSRLRLEFFMVEEAQTLLSAILPQILAVNGPQSVPAFVATSDLAEMYHAQRDYEKAVSMQYEILESAQKTLGKGHPIIATILIRLGEGLAAQDMYHKAELVFKQSVDLFKAHKPHSIKGLSIALKNLVQSLINQNKYDKAAIFADDELELRKTSLPKDRRGLRLCKRHLAQCLAAQGLEESAERILRDVLAEARTLTTWNNPSLQDVSGELESVLRKRGKNNEADKVAEELHDSSLGESICTCILNNVEGPIKKAYEAERYQEAESLQRYVLEEWQRIAFPGETTILEAQRMLRKILIKQGRSNEAVAISRQILDGYRVCLPEGNRYVVYAQEQLASDLTRIKNFEEAGELYREIAKAQTLPQPEGLEKRSYMSIFWETLSDEQHESRRKAACEDNSRRRAMCRSCNCLPPLTGSDELDSNAVKAMTTVNYKEKKIKKLVAVQELIKRKETNKAQDLSIPSRMSNDVGPKLQNKPNKDFGGGSQSTVSGLRISNAQRNDMAAQAVQAVLRTKLSYKATRAAKAPKRSSSKEAAS